MALSASDVEGDALTFSATGLPPGLSVNATTGAISGTIPFTAVAGSVPLKGQGSQCAGELYIS